MTDQSGPRSGLTTFAKACTVKSTGCLPYSTNLPTPPPTGTVQRSSLDLFESAVKIGVEVSYQPSDRL